MRLTSNVSRRISASQTEGTHRVIQGSPIAPRDTPGLQRASKDGNRMLMEAHGAIDAEPLFLERFTCWARCPYIGIRFEGWVDQQGALCWDVAGALDVRCVGQSVFTSCNSCRSQVTNDILCDRLDGKIPTTISCDRTVLPTYATPQLLTHRQPKIIPVQLPKLFS